MNIMQIKYNTVCSDICNLFYTRIFPMMGMHFNIGAIFSKLFATPVIGATLKL